MAEKYNGCMANEKKLPNIAEFDNMANTHVVVWVPTQVTDAYCSPYSVACKVPEIANISHMCS
jgi:hypothetical protein